MKSDIMIENEHEDAEDEENDLLPTIRDQDSKHGSKYRELEKQIMDEINEVDER